MVTFFQGNVETWLGDLLRMTRTSVHGIIREAAITITDPQFKLLEFENMFPAQVFAFYANFTSSAWSIVYEFHDVFEIWSKLFNV